ncbi:MoaD/ThiS family protein [Mycolicibacterium sp. S2-37]|uniref:MoaD/ThiS family protein n=1 Tax=Mycolicibacterium sp. S2-37 TaxID=2810297 RepID=UPI001A942F95|nr:MoaD/ThiS family protein [Mycolicibacterium sp. S2-37]MBO0680240.1 MoaD/ThiS family protein [Mycolicibacterium sp. S2-37]
MSSTTTVRVTVRFFAAARAAAGAESMELTLTPGTTVAEVVAELSSRTPELARVLARCSYLCDGVAVRDQTLTLDNAQTLDVLPPFAGG